MQHCCTHLGRNGILLFCIIWALGSKLLDPAGSVCILELRSRMHLRLVSVLASWMFRHKCRPGSAAVAAAARPGYTGQTVVKGSEIACRCGLPLRLDCPGTNSMSSNLLRWHHFIVLFVLSWLLGNLVVI